MHPSRQHMLLSTYDMFIRNKLLIIFCKVYNFYNLLNMIERNIIPNIPIIIFKKFIEMSIYKYHNNLSVYCSFRITYIQLIFSKVI